MMKVVFFISGLLFFVVGFLFKILHWPFSYIIVSFSVLSFLMSFVFHYWKKETSETNSILDQESFDDV